MFDKNNGQWIDVEKETMCTQETSNDNSTEWVYKCDMTIHATVLAREVALFRLIKTNQS